MQYEVYVEQLGGDSDYEIECFASYDEACKYSIQFYREVFHVEITEVPIDEEASDDC